MTTKPTCPHDHVALAGQWRRPEAEDRRGPCPALNSLANEGSLPRDGRVTVDQLVHALDERLGIPPSMAAPLAKLAMSRLGKAGPDGTEVLELSALRLHGFLEHDASLSRRDARKGDAAEVVPSLVDQLLAQSQDGRTLTLEDLATAHQLRMAQSAAGGHRVPLKAGVLGTIEAALLYEVLRGSDGVAIADAREFFERERVPGEVAPRRVQWRALLSSVVRIAVMGNWALSRAAKRARRAARECPFSPPEGKNVEHRVGDVGGVATRVAA